MSHLTFLCCSLLLVGGASLTLPANSPLITWQGRRVVQPSGGVSFDWQGIQASFTVTGATYVNVTFNSTFLASPAPAASAARALQDSLFPKFGVYRIFVDGVRGNNVTVYPGLSTQTIAVVEPSAAHAVNMWYSTDPVYNTWPDLDCVGCFQTVLAFTTDGSITPAPTRNRSLAIIGDSITAGNQVYHALCGNASSDDHSRTYGAQLCERFAANCSTTAVSSKGLYVNCCDDLPVTMPDFVMRTLAQDPGSMYDWSSTPVDAAIVALGTNDCGHDSGPAWEANFTSTYVDFLVNLTRWTGNPNLPIFCGVGPITTKYMPWVLNAMQIAGSSHGVRTTLLNFTGATLDGCGHPGVLGHDQMFAMAEPIVASVMGWA